MDLIGRPLFPRELTSIPLGMRRADWIAPFLKPSASRPSHLHPAVFLSSPTAKQSAVTDTFGFAPTSGQPASGSGRISPALFSNQPNSIDISTTRGIKLLLDPQQGVGQETELERLIHRLVPKYYQNLAPLDSQKIQDVLTHLAPATSDEDELFEILQASGPCIQKLFQLYCNKVGSEKLKKTLKRLQDDLRPFPIDSHKKQLQKEMGRNFEEVFPEFDERPVGVGTVAQVHRAVFQDSEGQKTPVAYKLRRPDYKEILAREFALLDRIVDDEFGRQIIEKLKTKTISEGDFNHEVKGLHWAKSYQMARVVRLAPGDLPVLEDAFGMIWMDGTTFSKLKSENREQLLQRYIRLSAVYKEWINRAFRGDRFLHGDPHAGNLSYDENQSPEIGYMDFGNWTTFNPGLENPFATLSQSVAIKSVDLAIKAFGELQGSPLNPAQISAIKKDFDQAVAGESTIVERVNNLFASATRVGIQIPDSAMAMQRGMMLFDFGFKDISTELTNNHSPLSITESQTIQIHGSNAVNLYLISMLLGAQIADRAASALKQGLRYFFSK